jgi:hypothetical protein
VQVAPQSIPAGALLTEPDPEPALVTVKLRVRTKFAVTALLASIVTSHVPLPEQAPDQPVNREPAAAVAVNATAVPLLNPAAHVVPQSMPAGALVTVPDPGPVLLTDRVSAGAKLAVAALSVLIVTVQGPVPEQAPDQPVNVALLAGVAVRTICELSPNAAEQVAPQLIPPGELVTVPVPAPVLLTVKVCEGIAAKFQTVAWAWSAA